MNSKNKLYNILSNIDGNSYKAYKSIEGFYDFENYTLIIDHVQGDPFATPSRIRVIVNQQKEQFPHNLFDLVYKKIAVKDYLTRILDKNIKKIYKRVPGSGKSGLLTIDAPGQELLDRTSVIIDKEKIEARFEVGLPANGRRILGKKAIEIFFKYLPPIINASLYYNNIDKFKLNEQILLSEDQNYIREQLKSKDLVAFVANGSILPRESGISQKVLKDNAIPFKSPKTLEIEMHTPNKGIIKGMGIKKGITLIVGGGYHGKSTLLKALELGVYNHVTGDGREYVITLEDAVKIRAEDGRSIEKVNISSFINNLPNGKDTSRFSTDNASGSTSQTANIMESMEIGTHLLLIDEDTSATNFMIRDGRMQKLVNKEKEPITPLIDIVKNLYTKYNISSVIVMGGSGDYFDVADNIIMMDNYFAKEVTNKAKEITKEFKQKRENNNKEIIIEDINRTINYLAFNIDRIKIKSSGVNSIVFNEIEINLNLVEQLIDPSQTRCISMIFQYIIKNKLYSKYNIKELINYILKKIDKDGLDSISYLKGHPGNLALPRKYEIASAINRFRKLVIK